MDLETLELISEAEFYVAILMIFIVLVAMIGRMAWQAVSHRIKERYDVDIDQAIRNGAKYAEELGASEFVADKTDTAYDFAVAWLRHRGWKIKEKDEELLKNLIISVLPELGLGASQKEKSEE